MALDSPIGRLRFPDAATESAYLLQHQEEAKRPRRVIALLAAIAITAFGVLDLGPDHPTPVTVLRFGLMVPLLLAFSWLVERMRRPDRSEQLAGIVFGLVAALEACYVLWAPSDRLLIYQTGFLFLLLGGYVGMRLRFQAAATAGLLASLFEVGVLARIHLTDWQLTAVVLYVLTANALGLVVAFQRERAGRAQFATARELASRSGELQELNLKLAELTVRDALTGLLNRRSFDERLEEAVARAQRAEKPTTLVLVDLDGFKEVNDTHGHAAGDKLLRQFGDLLRRRTRDSDLAFRLGGDEFCLLLPDSSASEGADVLRRSLSKLPASIEGESGPPVLIDFSAGSTEIRRGERCGEDALHRVDALLYLAKRRGKGCVMIESDGTEAVAVMIHPPQIPIDLRREPGPRPLIM